MKLSERMEKLAKKEAAGKDMVPPAKTAFKTTSDGTAYDCRVMPADLKPRVKKPDLDYFLAYD